MLDITKQPYNLTKEQQENVASIVGKMSPAAKIGQLFFVIGQDENQVDLNEFIAKYQPGGMMFRPDGATKLTREINTLQKASEVPLFIGANLESGGNGIVSEGTWVGNPLGLAATNDTQSARILGEIAGFEARQVGCNMSFAPIVDIDLNFRNPITNTRTYGSDVNRIMAMAQAQAKGLAENHVIPVIKHFPGDGVDERDQHLVASVNSLEAEDWLNSYGKIYQHFIDEGISTIMIGHILQPAWERVLQPDIKDSELLPATLSPRLINGLLRGKLGFQGLTMTDATPMIGYNVNMPRRDLLPATINAGVDMILFNKNIDEDYRYITEALDKGVISAERLDEAVTRIVATKMAQGLYGEGTCGTAATSQRATSSSEINASSNTIASTRVTSTATATIGGADQEASSTPGGLATILAHKAAHQKQVAEIAGKAVTLVKDRDQLLPLTPERYPRIRLVVLGDSSDGGFKEGGQVTGHFEQGLRELGFKVSVYDRSRLDFHEIFEEGVADLAGKFDLALYVANVETASNQTTTRLDWIHLMAADAPWFLRSIPTVFVSTANPYHLFDLPSVSTFVNAYTGNPETIDATLRKLNGQEAFCGTSPVDPFCGDLLAKY